MATTEDTILQMVRIDLGINTDVYDGRLKQYIAAATAEIEREGVHLSKTAVVDQNLIAQYAAWMWRKRDTGEGIPRMIRWQINNRLFGGEDNG